VIADGTIDATDFWIAVSTIHKAVLIQVFGSFPKGIPGRAAERVQRVAKRHVEFALFHDQPVG
jgi:hypothetical protein